MKGGENLLGHVKLWGSTISAVGEKNCRNCLLQNFLEMELQTEKEERGFNQLNDAPLPFFFFKNPLRGY